jgi:predicted ATPase/DNA-binding CsgD family transcriptional regulator
MSTHADIGENPLPRYLTSFVGRDQEIAAITARLMDDDVRILTLIGPGGAGKTRLAVESVGRLDEDAWEDIWFVPLVAVRDPALVLPSIAQALGLYQVTDRPVDETIVHFLGDRNVLLVIDNFELVTDAAPDLGRLLTACPGVTMLVTSRFALRIAGEHLFLVRPLETPDATDLPPNRLREVESVRLFLERVNMTGRRLTLSGENASSISRICQRLDGLPLALELAAARCGLLSPAALETVLQQGIGFLADGPRDAPDRHRSLHDAIAWSYDLLPEHEQAVFRRLAVFSGGFSVDAAQSIVDLPLSMIATITSLVAKSLLVPVTADTGEARFTMLETIREFGLEQLAMEGEAQEVRDRHAAYFLQEAIQGEHAWCMYLQDGRMWLERLTADHANMRDALQWLYETGDITTCLRMAGALAPLWAVCGNLDEGRAWLERLLADPRTVDDAVRANGLATFSWISMEQNRIDHSFEMAEEVIALSQRVDIPVHAIQGHVLAGIAAADLGQHDLARQRLETSIALMRGPSIPDWIENYIHNTMVMVGYVELKRGCLEEAEAWLHDAYAFDLARGYEPGTGYIMGSIVFSGLMWVARAQGDAPRALQYAQHHLRLNTDYPNVNFFVHAICDIAGALAALGQYIPAARLFGASEALHQLYGFDFQESFAVQRAVGLPEPWAREDEPCEQWEALRNALQPRTVPTLPASITVDALDRAWAGGRNLSLDAAVAEALAASAEPSLADDQMSMHDLSPRQVEVLRLIAEGHSNRAIADTLSLSERTVEHHVTHILAKLDLDSRTAAATFAVRHGLVDV